MSEKGQVELASASQTGKLFPTFFGLIGALVGVGTVVLHLVGNISHIQYLRYWGLDAGMFPKPVEWVLINGYYSVVNRLVAIFSTLMSNATWLFGSVIVLAIYGFACSFFPNRLRSDLPKWTQLSDWRGRLVRYTYLSCLAISGVPAVLLAVTAAMMIPAALGESAGDRVAREQSEEYAKGCGSSKLPCVQLKNGSNVVVQGFVLDISLSHMAIFDVQLQEARVVPLEKLDIVSNAEQNRRARAVPN